jgi:hypothetical protein
MNGAHSFTEASDCHLNGPTETAQAVQQNHKGSMNTRLLIQPGDKLKVVTNRCDDDKSNNGSVVIERIPGHVYCIAKAPRYTSDDEWRHNAELIAKAVERMHAESAQPVTVAECMEIVNKVADTHDEPTCTCDGCKHVRKAREIVARARGGKA